MKKIFLALLTFYIFYPTCFSHEYKNINGFTHIKHKHSESAYQHAYCSKYNGIEEFENKDKTRVDCLTSNYAIEFDFYNKWAECVGQALYYGIITGKTPKCVLILDGSDWKNKIAYFNRIKSLGNFYNFCVEYITDDILNLQNEKCPFLDCKCHKK